MKAKYLSFVLVILLVAFGAGNVAAHCEVPSGIYDDNLRADLIAEHLTTIETSMKKIMELSRQNPVNYNQLVRWVSNKEEHSDEIQHIVSQYFMTQRIKLDAKKYSEKLTVLHKMLIYAMKCKQTTDPSNVSRLRSLVKKFEILYFGRSTR
ncbi:MAG: superoxide dismutase [Deltaproteobacteria bacterium]|nr:MAG: superoxide dismutase [Deltaproteobacteria bacterium]